MTDLAHFLLHRYGMGRLSIMRSEYMAGLPKWMPEHEKQARITAINELLTTPAAGKTKTKK